MRVFRPPLNSLHSPSLKYQSKAIGNRETSFISRAFNIDAASDPRWQLGEKLLVTRAGRDPDGYSPRKKWRYADEAESRKFDVASLSGGLIVSCRNVAKAY